MNNNYAIGRLVLSSRNTYKISGKSAKQCTIISESMENILINSNKEFNPIDNYVLVDTKIKQLVDNYGSIGNEDDDINIYHHLYTYFWMSNSKLSKYLKNWDLEYDICASREIYDEQVITIDPDGSTDLDDGFSLKFIDDISQLDIHIADPTSYFDLSKDNTWTVLEELGSRISTCYIPLNNKIKHLLPEISISGTNLLEKSTLIGNKKRAITFSFKINSKTNKVDFIIRKTILNNIVNTTYEKYDKFINADVKYKNKLIALCKFMINNMNCSIEFNSETDISHSLIEVFMIWTNYYTGNYLHNEKNKMLVRTQDKFANLEAVIPEYSRTFLNIGAKYQFINSKTDIDFIHHSLGIKNYCHITSPMRRFVDMINHLLLHDIDLIDESYSRLIKLINIENINSRLKTYKKISNAYNLIVHLKITNKFKACIFDILKNNKVLLVLCDRENNFKKIIKVELPIEYNSTIKQFDEFNIELYYNPYKFKSKSFPFSIKIIN
jgi:exoribonuclease R